MITDYKYNIKFKSVLDEFQKVPLGGQPFPGAYLFENLLTGLATFQKIERHPIVIGFEMYPCCLAELNSIHRAINITQGTVEVVSK